MKIKTNIFNIFLTFAITFASFFVIQNYVPLKYLETKQIKLGTSITTIQSTDTLKNSRATINDNFTALNNGKIEISTTTLPLIATLSGLTSAASLATVGTITSGTWSGTAILTAKGGTGSTTLAANQLLLGNGTGNIGIVSGLGITGQFLTSNGAGTAPTWQTSAVDTAINYTWTGGHLWSGAASTSLLAVLNTLYVGTTATSTIQGSISGTTQLQGYVNVLGTSGTSTFSSNLAVSNNASTTNLTVSGTCVGCLNMYVGSDSTPSDTTDDTNIKTIGFQPRMIFFEIDAADANENSWAWGRWTDPEGDGTGSYSVVQSEIGFGSVQRQTDNAHSNTFADGEMRITFGNFTSTGFSITYDKNAINLSSASISFTAIK